MATSTIRNIPSIVEQGTSGVWTYRKWSDGTAECWGKLTFSLTINAGAIVSAGAPSLPSIFIEPPTLNVSGGGVSNPQVSPIFVANSGNDKADIWFRNLSASGSNTSQWAFVHAIGKWK